MGKRTLCKLSAIEAAKLNTPGRHSDGGGLYLSIDNDGRRRWVFLYVRNGKRTELGLGGGRDLSLANARTAAVSVRAMMSGGQDPKVARAKDDRVPTFGEAADAYIEAMKPSWRNAKHAAQWRAMRIHLDKRKGEEKIADDYDWADLHHIHSVVRSFYNGCPVEQEAVGSFLSTPVTLEGARDRFDFSDLYLARTMVLCVDDCALFAVFDDSGGALSRFYPTLERVTGPLSHIQVREVLAELAFLNLNLKERPTFHTECDMAAETCRIFAVRPQLDLVPVDLRVRGRLLRHALYNVPDGMQFAGVSREEVLAAIDAGTMSFLFDDKGDFIKEPMKSEPNSSKSKRFCAVSDFPANLVGMS